MGVIYDAEGDLFEFEGHHMHSTGRAMLIRYENEEVWIPMSQVTDWDFIDGREPMVTVVIPLWLAKEKGIYE